MMNVLPIPCKDVVPKDREECDACHFATRHLHKCDPPITSRRSAPYWFCDLCYITHAGSAAKYPDQFEHKAVMFQLNHVANIILEAFNRRTNGV